MRKEKRGVALETAPRRRTYRFGNAEVCAATAGIIVPVMLGRIAGLIFACLVKGGAPLFVSKICRAELKASVRACRSGLDLPEQSAKLPWLLRTENISCSG